MYVFIHSNYQNYEMIVVGIVVFSHVNIKTTTKMLLSVVSFDFPFSLVFSIFAKPHNVSAINHINERINESDGRGDGKKKDWED